MAIKSSDQITIVDVTDAYSVSLTSEVYSFVGGTNGVESGASCTTQAVGWCGSSQSSNVTVDATKVVCPTGISASVTGSGTSIVTITFTTTATISTACEATIPVVVDGVVTMNKKFSFAVAKAGATGAKGDTGKGISSVTITYGSSSSNTTAPTCDATTPPSVSAGSYLWTKFVYNYTDGTSSNPAYSVAKQGSTGATGTSVQWYTGTGITGTSTTATIFSSSGITAAKVGDMYLNTSTSNTYKCTTAGAAAAAKWVYVSNIKGGKGDTGAAGADAITISITSSNGTVFKNSSGSTVLTAHVYKAGAEQSITDAGVVANSLGSIKWYKGTSTTAVATAKTLTVSASDVTNAVAYTCQLEG